MRRRHQAQHRSRSDAERPRRVRARAAGLPRLRHYASPSRASIASAGGLEAHRSPHPHIDSEASFYRRKCDKQITPLPLDEVRAPAARVVHGKGGDARR